MGQIPNRFGLNPGGNVKGMGEDSAKRVSAGAASRAKRSDAYFEWRMTISSKVLDAPEIAILADGAEIEGGEPQRLRADFRVPAIKATEKQIG